MEKETEQIRVAPDFKSWLDKQKLVPMETYGHVLERLLKFKRRIQK